MFCVNIVSLKLKKSISISEKFEKSYGFEHYFYSLKQLEISINNEFVYVCGLVMSHIIVFNLENLTFSHLLKGHKDIVLCLATDKEKKLLLSGGRDLEAIFWKVDIKNGKIKKHTIISRFKDSEESIIGVRIVSNRPKAFVINQLGTIFEIETMNFTL